MLILSLACTLFLLLPHSLQAQVAPPAVPWPEILGAVGPLCTKPMPQEKYECPEVECDPNPFRKSLVDAGTSTQFKKRVEQYFKYEPPADNRSVYLDKSFHDYDINKTGESTRPPAFKMDQPSLICQVTLPTGEVVSERCQDNRWRDTCLIGDLNLDFSYLAGRKLTDVEEPLRGVAGSSPIYDKNSSKLNCLVPKNTERISPLELDNGWRYRDMCPGSQKLRRVERDQLEETLDIFRGTYGCLSPLPKCDLKSDWKIGNLQWKNQEYQKYFQAFGSGLVGTVGTTLGLSGNNLKLKLKQILDSDQFDAIEKLLKPKQSAAAECKPAYWVRLMLDSCANQYILNKGINPDYVYNPDGKKTGYSPRFCQPFKTVPLKAWEKEEYDISVYLNRSYKGLLVDDYMPWVDYDRHEGDFSDDSKQYREDNWPERKIKWKGAVKANNVANFAKFKLDGAVTTLGGLQKTINKYAAHPVERIVDPLHPYSPRYDIAETVDSKLLTDRNFWGPITESKARWAYLAKFVGRLEKYWCVPNPKNEGYWEFGCTIYCSAVNVDLLRFRYKDYRICMGCQIDTNEKAFWDEYQANRKYYVKEYCWPPKTHSDCEYGDRNDHEVCGACGRAVLNWALYALYNSMCSIYTPWFCALAEHHKEKAQRYTIIYCPTCYTGAMAEALARARYRTNKKEEPEWGPTAMGDNWPVCSTRFDHKGDAGKCKEAKQEYGCERQGEIAEDDPNIAKESKDYAEKCIDKSMEDICHDAAKPVYSVNFLKIRARKGDFKTDDGNPPVNIFRGEYNLPGDFDDKVKDYQQNYADEDPAPGYGFREYFGNHRPYMRWWDTGKESFQVGTKPDYWCDWGQNDAIMGVGRDYNSIHGRKAQLCRYGGGGGIGDSCFTMQDWKDGKDIPHDRKFPSLAGSEWAELKMYQANCFREEGMNCLCQYEKVFKEKTSEDKALAMMGAMLNVPYESLAKGADNDAVKEIQKTYWPLSWRGYASTPANRDTNITSPAIETNQQFPNAYGSVAGSSIISGGLDQAKVGDVAIWPAGVSPSGIRVMPHVAVIVATHNLNDYGSINKVPDKSRWVQVVESNNGKYPDACGNTSYLGRGPTRTIYADIDEVPKPLRNLIEEQVVSTYYCYDPELGDCVEREWDNIKLYRPSQDTVRD